jgi:vacuolar-type H+-ATPase subunit I/STV1
LHRLIPSVTSSPLTPPKRIFEEEQRIADELKKRKQLQEDLEKQAEKIEKKEKVQEYKSAK